MSKHSLQTEGLHSAIVIKTIVLAEVRHTHQWNRIENRKTDPHKYAQVIFDKYTKTI